MATASALLQVMMDAVRKAGRGLRRDFGEVGELQVSKKGPGDFVTAADIKAEQTLFELLAKARPGYSFLGEERGMIEGTDKTHTWIVDPLDGTTNFLHALPQWAVNVALEREGAVVAAVTYNPITDEMFWAEKGRGAWLGDTKRLRVSARRDLTDSILATGIPFTGRPGHTAFLKELHQIAPKVAGVRRFGGRLAGHGLRRRRPLRRLLGARHQGVGRGGGRPAHRGSRRRGLWHGRRAFRPPRGARVLREPGTAAAGAEPPEGSGLTRCGLALPSRWPAIEAVALCSTRRRPSNFI